MTDPDLDLIRRSQAGDAAAFGEIVVKYQSLLAAMLHRFATSHADLEDLVQDSFVKAWQGLGSWEPRQPFVHWLKRIAVRTALEACRRRKASPIVASAQMPDVAASTQDEASARALDEARALLSHLPPDEQVLLTLVHLQGLSMEEAASHFGWSRAKAKIKAFRARHSSANFFPATAMNDIPPRNWQRLTALARQAHTPGVDVSVAVQTAIRALPAPAPTSVVDILSSFTGSRGWQTVLGCLVVLAVFAGYHGFENADVLQFTLGFSL